MDRLCNQQGRVADRRPRNDGSRMRRRRGQLLAAQSGGPDARRKPPADIAQKPCGDCRARSDIGRRGRRLYAQRLLDGCTARQLGNLVVLCRDAAGMAPQIQPQPRNSGIHPLPVGVEVSTRPLSEFAGYGHRIQQARTAAPQTQAESGGRTDDGYVRTDNSFRYRAHALHAVGQCAHAGFRPTGIYDDGSGKGFGSRPVNRLSGCTAPHRRILRAGVDGGRGHVLSAG